MAMAMAAVPSPALLSHGLQSQHSTTLVSIFPSGRGKGVSRITAAAAPMKEFGARDPFPAELESKFGEKVLGNPNTEHVILVPSMPLAIAEKSCSELPADAVAMSEDDAKELLRKVVGWRLVNQDGCMKLQCDWKLKSYGAGVELFSRIAAIAESENYYPELLLEAGNRAVVEIWSHTIGGLSENDFILAAKIDKIDTSDLIKKNRVWA